MTEFSSPSSAGVAERAAERMPEQEPAGDAEGLLWAGDKGTLPLDARRAMLQLIRGPFIDASRHKELTRALLANRDAIEARLNDLLLDLVVDTDSGIAFVRNAACADDSLPKAVRNIFLTLTDTILVLTLRRELLCATSDRVIVGKDETIASLEQYRPISRLDESAFRKRLETSWRKMRENNIVLPLPDSDERYEVSPALAVVFGVEEARAASDAISAMLAQVTEGDDVSTGSGAAEANWGEGEPGEDEPGEEIAAAPAGQAAAAADGAAREPSSAGEQQQLDWGE